MTLAQYLLERGVTYDLVPHPHTQTARESAAASRLPADRVVKAVAIKLDHGFMLALLPASRRVNFDVLRRIVGTEIDIAGEEQVETLFVDCEPGSVPGLGEPYGLEMIVDDSLDRQPDLYLEGGDHAHLVHLSGASFRALTQQARHGHFTA
jgi:Ala-tRNA(Pro) deacylase